MTTSELRPSLADTARAHDDDVAAIHRIVADIETAFNTNDPDLMNAHFAADGSAVNAVGHRLRGIDAMRDAAEAGLSGFVRDQYVRYEVTDVEFPRPDVALAYKMARATDADGAPLRVGHDMVALYVLVKDDGRWWIIARQNTLVPEQS
ncbi:MAG: SgcJ/EcaC family oxidoreductase [Nocardioidaceae bacterium]